VAVRHQLAVHVQPVAHTIDAADLALILVLVEDDHAQALLPNELIERGARRIGIRLTMLGCIDIDQADFDLAPFDAQHEAVAVEDPRGSAEKLGVARGRNRDGNGENAKNSATARAPAAVNA
jgi:hypothetical protein